MEAGLYIKQVAQVVGVSPSTLRLWERHDLVAPARSGAGYRIYSYADVQVLQRIRDICAAEGFNARRIRQALSEEPGGGNGQQAQDHRLLDEGFGPRLRRMRLERGVSLRQLGARTGLSPSHISSLERGLSYASVSSLQKLAAALGTSVSETLGDSPSPPDEMVVRRGEGRRVDAGGPGVEVELLSPQEDLLEPSLMRIPGGAEGRAPDRQRGERFIHVMEGQLELVVEETHVLSLSKGDSATFKTHRPHRWRNPGRGDTLLFWVSTPPMLPAGGAGATAR